MNQICDVNKITYQAADILSKKWIINILLDLNEAEKHIKRYSEIKRNIPDISPKILSSRLKELEVFGVISKNIDTTKYPIKCEYSLTNSGKELISVIKNIENWTVKWKNTNDVCNDD